MFLRPAPKRNGMARNCLEKRWNGLAVLGVAKELNRCAPRGEGFAQGSYAMDMQRSGWNCYGIAWPGNAALRKGAEEN